MLLIFDYLTNISNKMKQLNEDTEKSVIVINELGLHARPAAMIARLARKARSSVWLIKNGEQVDASSIIDILAIEGSKGTGMTVRIDHPEDIEILNEIINLFENGFKE